MFQGKTNMRNLKITPYIWVVKDCGVFRINPGYQQMSPVKLIVKVIKVVLLTLTLVVTNETTTIKFGDTSLVQF